MLKAFATLFRNRSDQLTWSLDWHPHATGEFSMAVVQANRCLEDRCQVYSSNELTIVGIFDGHRGSNAARFVNDRLISSLETLAKEQGMSESTILSAFRDTEAAFLDFVRENALPGSRLLMEVGCCCIVGVISNAKLYVANLGDSIAVLGNRYDFLSIQAQRLTAVDNVNDCNHRREYISQYQLEPNPVFFNRGTFRIKGICKFTKSIGDFYLKRTSMKREGIEFQSPLLSAVPVVRERELTHRDKFLIFASDGFWKVMSDEDAVQLVYKNRRSGIAERLIKAALRKVAEKYGTTYARLVKTARCTRRIYHDDMSVVVLFIDHQTRPILTNISVRPPLDIFAHNQRA